MKDDHTLRSTLGPLILETAHTGCWASGFRRSRDGMGSRGHAASLNGFEGFGN